MPKNSLFIAKKISLRNWLIALRLVHLVHLKGRKVRRRRHALRHCWHIAKREGRRRRRVLRAVGERVKFGGRGRHAAQQTARGAWHEHAGAHGRRGRKSYECVFFIGIWPKIVAQLRLKRTNETEMVFLDNKNFSGLKILPQNFQK